MISNNCLYLHLNAKYIIKSQNQCLLGLTFPTETFFSDFQVGFVCLTICVFGWTLFVFACVCVCMCPIYICVMEPMVAMKMGRVIIPYVHLMCVATGGRVARLWERGVCVYHVWLCSWSWAINHTSFCVCV